MLTRFKANAVHDLVHPQHENIKLFKFTKQLSLVSVNWLQLLANVNKSWMFVFKRKLRKSER